MLFSTVKYASPRDTAVKCPVCEGATEVSKSLYKPSVKDSKKRVSCKSCKGRGYILVPVKDNWTWTDSASNTSTSCG